MSVRAASWAFEQDLPCAHKFVLVALGDSAGSDDSCWPAQKTLAFKTGLSRSRVNVILGELEEQGYLTFELRKRPDGSDTSCKYTLNIPDTPLSMKDVRNTVLGDVYVVSSENLTKVGISRQSERRIKGLISATGRDVKVEKTWTLSMPQVRQVEKIAHKALSTFRTAGEWFSCSPDQAIEAVLEAITVSCGKTPPVAPSNTGCPIGGHPPVSGQDTNEPSRLNQVKRTKNISISTDLSMFEDWYRSFPRHIGRAAAEKAYTKALSRGSPSDLLAGASRYAAERSGEDENFTKHPATWLNQDCWLDEPTGKKRNGKLTGHQAFAAAAFSIARESESRYGDLDDADTT